MGAFLLSLNNSKQAQTVSSVTCICKVSVRFSARSLNIPTADSRFALAVTGMAAESSLQTFPFACTFPFLTKCSLIILPAVRTSVVLKALRYEPEGSRFETRRGEKTFWIHLIPPAALGPGVHSASNRNRNGSIKIMFLESGARRVV
jgi:hypothetical protein